MRAGADKNEYLLPGSCFVYCPYSLEEFFFIFSLPRLLSSVRVTRQGAWLLPVG